MSINLHRHGFVMIFAPCRTTRAQAKMHAKNLITCGSAPRVYTHGYKNVAPTELIAKHGSTHWV